MGTVERLKNGVFGSAEVMNAESGASNGQNLAGIHTDMTGLDELEQQIVLQLEEEFGSKDLSLELDVPALPEITDLPENETSSRLLEIRRKRDLSSGIEDEIREGAGLLGNLAKQIGTLSDYLEKTETDLKRLERIEASSTKLRIASEGLVRNNHEMKATIEEQRKKITLLESKIASLRDANEIARTNLARLMEEKRIATVDLSALQSDIARVENDKRIASERAEQCEEENRALKGDLSRAKDREKMAALEMRKQEDDISRKSAEIDELRELKTQASIEIEELKSRNAALETVTVEQKSRIEELTFELKSGRKEMEEVIRLKQQRILELEARGVEHGKDRQEIAETPPIAPEEGHGSTRSAKTAPKATAKADAKPASKTETKTAAKSEASKSEAKQPVKAG